MKILIVCPHNSNKGGLVKVAERQFNILNENYFTCNYHFTSDVSNSIVSQIVKMLYFPFNLMLNQYDVIHIHVASKKSYFRKLFYFIFSLMLSKLFVVHIHGGAFENFLKTSRFAKETLRYIVKSEKCKVVCLTETLNLFLRSNFTIYNRPFVLRNPGRIGETEIVRLERRNENRLIFVGRLCKEKGVNNLVVAIHELKKLGHIYYLDIYGDGILKEELVELICNLNLSENVSLKGWVDDSTIPYFEYTFNILPSEIEAMPLSVIEAMQQGVPSIVTNVGAIEEMLVDGVDSIILNDNSPNEIMTGILAASGTIYSNLVENALKNFNHNYSANAFMSSCSSIYTKED